MVKTTTTTTTNSIWLLSLLAMQAIWQYSLAPGAGGYSLEVFLH